jgi:hypothetical protein
MAHEIYSPDTELNVLTWIREGMPVYGSDEKKIGKVKHVHFGDGAEIDSLAKPLDFYDLPSEIQERLARDGFVQIDCGFFTPYRFAAPEHIADLDDDGLRLSVTGDLLITL